MKVKINSVDEFCAALKAGYMIKDKDCAIRVDNNDIWVTPPEDDEYVFFKLSKCYYEKPDLIKIECGKYYKTRDGHKALVLVVSEDSLVPLPIQGVVFTSDEKKITAVYWNFDGYFRRDKEEDVLDLVSEWKEE